MSHVWCAPILIRERDGSYCAFEGNLKIWGIKLYATIIPPASADTRPEGGAPVCAGSPFTSGAIAEGETPNPSTNPGRTGE